MKNKKNLKYMIIAIILIIIATTTIIICAITNNKENVKEQAQTEIITNIEYDYEDEDINWRDNQYTDIILNNENITIEKAGTYHLTGELQDGNVTVNVGDNDLVRLVLDNANIKCSNSSAINVENAEKVVIVLEEGTTNNVSDGETYSNQDEPDSAIFSKDDLVIAGKGTLNVTANYLDGIVSKDGLKILNSTLNITANDDGIRGKDYIGIKDADITIKANSDGIKATNDTDTEKGYIQIDGGNINIDAGEDGIQAETNVKIINGKFNILTGEGSKNSSTTETWGNWGDKQQGKMINPMSYTNSTEEVSAKGIKGNLGIQIESGVFTIDSSDDSIHSNGTVIINGGELDISSGDDGIHADESIYINDGKIDIKKSYEGIESSLIEINGGNINLVASDDGINVAGGNDSSSMNGRPGQNNFNNNSNQKLTINNGYIVVDATGDGIDINGSGYINGGTILVNGPTDNGNGALDYDGTFKITGGLLIAAGSSGMMQATSSDSTQYSIAYIYSVTQTAGSKITLKDSNGTEITSFTPSKNYTSVVISSNELKKGENYTIYSNDQKIEEITISSIITNSGSNSKGMQNGGMQQPNGKGQMIY